MNQFSRAMLWACLSLWVVVSAPGQQILINEIMYHPASEDPREEYVELFNAGTTNVNLSGWTISSGIGFLFPAGTTLAPGQYLVVAANASFLDGKYPNINNLVGDWLTSTVTNVVGHSLTNYSPVLSNTRNTINLNDATGKRIDSVTYADEGDWAVRQRGPNDLNRRGWIWNKPHDGDPVLRASLELINPNLPNEHGQNWKASAVPEGTPGYPNSVASGNIAPLLLDVMHQPAVPRSTDPITITCRVLNETPTGLTVQLNWRVDAATPPPFTTTTMFDDGLHGDSLAGDGLYGATISAQANGAVIEYYVYGRDPQGNERTWPAPAIGSPDGGVGPVGQVVNALFQVDDDSANRFGGTASMQPVYKMILTENERAELAAIPSSSPNSDAQMNMTFISLDAQGVEVRYLCSVRNRGHGSRSANPPNYRVNFRSDQRWKGVTGMNLNSTRVHTQHFGSVLANKSGAVGAYSRAVQLRVNNANRATSGSSGRVMFGSYAANEADNSDWADRHYPDDNGGNLYKVVRDIGPPNFDYRGTDPTPYRRNYFKQSNASEDNWLDLMAMLSVMGENSTDLFTLENIRKVINLDQWLTHIAVMNLFSNGESGFNTGNNDDYYMYRGVKDPRFLLLFHDLDSILGQPESMASNLDIFRSTCCPISGDSEGVWRAMNRFLRSPEIQPLYFQTLQRLLDTTFSETQYNALIDQILGSYVTGTTIPTMKTWMDQRRASVQSQLGGYIPWNTNKPIATISGEPRSPTPSRNATLIVGGNGITHYRYKLNNGAFNAETPVGTPLSLSSLPNGSTNTVFVIGKNSDNVWQAIESPTVSRVWVVNTTWPTVRLNEVLASNQSAVPHQGTFPDLIELHNEGTATVDLGGMRISDDPSNPNKFTLPAGTTLAAGAYRVLYANDPDGTPGIHLGFTLDQDGEGVYLFPSVANGNVALDSVTFGMQITDLSIGRIGSGGTWALGTPTAGAANVAQALGNETELRINEWLASPQAPFADEFVELYNLNSAPVALGGLLLTDTPLGRPGRHRIADLSFIGANDFATFIADGNGGAADHLNFGLDSDQGEIALFTANRAPIDCVAYGPQFPGISQGRCPDGSATNRSLALPTPGTANACPVPPTPPVMVNILPLTSVWRYYTNGVEPAPNWKDVAYDDAGWPGEGPALLGRMRTTVGAFLPEPILTPIGLPLSGVGKITYHFRSRLNITSLSNITSLQISNVVDDGAVFYINGTEVGRFNMPAGAVTTNTPSLNGVVDAVWANPTPLAISVTNLQPGLNVIAVEVHNTTVASADLIFGMRLDGIIASAAPGSVVINEILADNATIAELDGSTPDWAELYNPTGAAVDLSGLSLADGGGNRWFFPPGSLINGQGYFRVRFDADQPASLTNTGFGLKATGDVLTLYNRAPQTNTPVDSRSFGLQTADFSIGRAPSGGNNWGLTLPTIGSANLAATLGSVSQLRINEWLADPQPGEDDWFEIYNPNPQPVDISFCYFADSSTTHRLGALCFLGANTNAWQKFVADDNVAAGSDHMPFKLGGSSDSVSLANSNGVPIDSVTWNTAQTPDVSEGRLPDGNAAILRFPGTKSPGDPNFASLTNVVVNEVLTHTDPPLEDAIELHNPTATPVNLTGWWLSDSKVVPRKYQVPPGTVIPPGGFAVFYEAQFNNSDLAAIPFALSSAEGDQVYLSSASTEGVMSGYRNTVNFGPSANGVSFGRYRTSVGFDFTAMSQRTFGVDSPTSVAQFRTGTGRTNAYPKLGAIVISEIMYHPPDLIGSGVTNDNLIEEFVELRNTSAGTVPLYDPLQPTNGWRLRDAVDFRFNTSHSIPAGGHLIVVSFDPANNPVALAQFQARYGSGLALVGPYTGKLDNGGESVELVRPDTPQPDGSVPSILVEKVVYGDRAPWPINADGLGMSLQRVSATGYANDPTNWVAAAPALGGPGAMDTDGDGMSDSWEDLYGFLKNNPNDATQDFDLDGMTNLEEYLAGTHPKQAGSLLELSPTLNANTTELRFTAVAGRTYTILYSDVLFEGASWLRFADVPAPGTTQVVMVPDNSVAIGLQRFYRIVTPALP